MSTFKVFHKGSYYRLSSVPVSLAHLRKVLIKITEEQSTPLYFLSSGQSQVLATEDDFQSLLPHAEIVVYTEVPTSELVDYIDLQKSILMNPDQTLTELIRQEILKQSQVLASSSVVHNGSVCSSCSQSPIVGVRYFCKSCKIDFCEQCEETGHSHPLLKFRTEKQAEEGRVVNQMIKKELNLGKPQLVKPQKPVGVKPEGSRIFEAAKTLKELGFNDDRVNLEALECNNYELEPAIEYLLIRQ